MGTFYNLGTGRARAFFIRSHVNLCKAEIGADDWIQNKIQKRRAGDWEGRVDGQGYAQARGAAVASFTNS